LEDGGFADAGSEGREVGSEGGGEGGRGGGDFVAETVEVLLCGGDGAGGEELLQPDLELLVVTAVGFIPEEDEE